MKQHTVRSNTAPLNESGIQHGCAEVHSYVKSDDKKLVEQDHGVQNVIPHGQQGRHLKIVTKGGDCVAVSRIER